MIGCRDCGGVLHGSVGLVRSLLGVRHLSQGAVKQRLEICRGCELSVVCRHNDRQVCRCNACGCWLKHKTRLRGESCPKGKW
jgi:hypothetical protein